MGATGGFSSGVWETDRLGCGQQLHVTAGSRTRFAAYGVERTDIEPGAKASGALSPDWVTCRPREQRAATVTTRARSRATIRSSRDSHDKQGVCMRIRTRVRARARWVAALPDSQKP